MNSFRNNIMVIILIITIITRFCFLFFLPVSESDFAKSNLFQTNQLIEYKFAVFWPKGTCLEYVNTPCYKHQNGLPNFFTIHGLWVIDRSEDKQPSPQEFDKDLLKDLEEDLTTYWPHVVSFDESSTKAKERHKKENQGFWKREWDKHGRVDPLFKNEFHMYYEHTLRLLRDLDVTNILINLEGKPNTPQLVREALQMHHLTIPILLCVKDKASGQVYLAELQFCMDETALNYMDCDPDEGKKDKKKCKEGQTFIYDSDAIPPTMNVMFDPNDDVAGELVYVT